MLSRLDQQGRIGIKPIARQCQIGDVPLEPGPFERSVFFKSQILAGGIAIAGLLQFGRVAGDDTQPTPGEGQVVSDPFPIERIIFIVLKGEGFDKRLFRLA